MRRDFRCALRFCIPVALCVLLGCSPKKSETPQERVGAAQALFERTTKDFHIPSAEAKGAEKEKLQNQAAAGYEEFLKKYPEQENWAAEALRSLGNIRATQGKLDEAVRNYAAVEKKYPQQRWEVLMSWKSAADLLWEAGRREEAKAFYKKIIPAYDNPGATQVERTIVKGSKMRLEGKEPLGNGK
jgi:TolA-binding protein